MNFLAVMLQAQGRPGGNYGLMVTVIYIVSFGLIAYFLLIRPQRRAQQQHQQMLSELKRNDEVMTDGGLIGTIVHIAEDRVTVKTGDTRVIVARGKINRVLNGDATAQG